LGAVEEFGEIGGQHRFNVFAELRHRFEKARALFSKIRIC